MTQTELDHLKELIVALLEQERIEYRERFTSIEKAIEKSENAQHAYNITEYQQLQNIDSQHKESLPRPEFVVLHRALEERMDLQGTSQNNKLVALQESYERITASIREDIAALRESRSEVSGSKQGVQEFLSYIVAIGAIVISIIFHFIK